MYSKEDKLIHEKIMEKLSKMTPREIFDSSVRAGIHRPNGELTANYKDPKEWNAEDKLEKIIELINAYDGNFPRVLIGEIKRILSLDEKTI